MVSCIAVNHEVDLKKLAKVSGNKKVEMIHVKELLGLTGISEAEYRLSE